MVVGQVYRSGHPIDLNYPFLETLNLQTIIYLGHRSAADNEDYYNWARSQGIKLYSFDVKPSKEPFGITDPSVMEDCLHLIVDKANHPILIHSDKGKHRVGVLVGIIRKCISHWSITAIYEEYNRFAKGKAGIDMVFIEQFEPRDLKIVIENAPEWVKRAIAYENDELY